MYETKVQGVLIKLPEHQSALQVVPGFYIQFPGKKPCAWIRFWHRVILGFVWADSIEEFHND